MEDTEIIDLFWQRNEAAIAETKAKYSRYCFSIANNLLHSPEDSEEVVNDSYAGTWHAIPPHRPSLLKTFIGKITRRLALKKLRERTAEKRGGGETCLLFDELESCISNGLRLEEHLEAQELTACINRFLETLPVDERRVFICRYWYFESIGDISKRFGFGQSKVKTMLMRTRKKLGSQLEKEGFVQ